MRLRGWIAVAVVPLALSACYTAEVPLVTEANSVAPYAKIGFREEAAKEVTTLTRSGTAYTLPSADGQGAITLRFMAAGRPDWYVVQVTSPSGGTGPGLLFAVIRIDLAKRQALSFRALGDLQNPGPGARNCNDLVCIDDIRAYANAAIAYAEMGGPPDATYEVTVE
jgi:hypothetical protein